MKKNKITQKLRGAARSLILINAFVAFVYALGALLCYGQLPAGMKAGWYIVFSMVLFFAEYSYRLWLVPLADDSDDTNTDNITRNDFPY